MGIFLKLLYRYRPIKNQDFLKEIEKLILNLIWEYKRMKTAKRDLCKKKKKMEKLYTLISKLIIKLED